MKPLLILITVFLIALLSSKILVGEYRIGQAGRIAMAGMLVFTAVGHFVYSKGMSLMMPAFVPYKATIVFLTGILEIVFAVGLLFPVYRVVVAWALIVFLVMILPANVYAAATQLDYQKGTFDGNGLEYLWFRVPLQFFFYCLVLFVLYQVLNLFLLSTGAFQKAAKAYIETASTPTASKPEF